jgi:hypothetical protein
VNTVPPVAEGNVERPQTGRWIRCRGRIILLGV